MVTTFKKLLLGICPTGTLQVLSLAITGPHIDTCQEYQHWKIIFIWDRYLKMTQKCSKIAY